jgi:hypothetical protein
MPPLSTTIEELDFALAALESAIVQVLAPTNRTSPPADTTGFQLRSGAPGA